MLPVITTRHRKYFFLGKTKHFTRLKNFHKKKVLGQTKFIALSNDKTNMYYECKLMMNTALLSNCPSSIWFYNWTTSEHFTYMDIGANKGFNINKVLYALTPSFWIGNHGHIIKVSIPCINNFKKWSNIMCRIT